MINQDQVAETDTIGDYFAVILRRWVTFVIVVGLVCVLGAVWIIGSGASYRASASVLVEPIAEPCTDASKPPEVNLANEREIADSLTTANVVKAALDTSSSPASLLSGLVVEALPDTEILRFTYTAPSSRVAKQRAQGFAEGYFGARTLNADNKITDCKERLDQDVRSIGDQLATNISATEQSPVGSAQRAQLTAERTGIEQQIRITQERLVALRSVNTRGGRIVKAASTAKPVPKSRQLILTVALALVLGAVAAFMRDRFDNRIRSTRDLLRAGLPSAYAEVDATGRSADGRAGYGRLRAALRSDPGCSSAILIVGSDTVASTAAVTAGIAVSYRGTRRAIVCVGTTAHEIEKLLRMGSAAVGDGRWNVRPAPTHEGLSVVTGIGVNGTSADELRWCLDTLRQEFDLLITVIEPLGDDGPLDLAPLFDAVVVVVAASTARAPEIAAIVRDLQEAGGSVIGSVLVV